MTEGAVTEVISWPPDSSAQDTIRPGQGADGNWHLGPSGAGRVRARLEVTAGADLLVRRGENLVRIPVLAILERPQHTPPQSPLTVNVERLTWDSLIVDMGPVAEDGMVSPSVAVPVVVKYNIVAPETAEVMVRTTAVLRQIGSDEALWQYDEREQVPANRLDPPPRVLTVPSPGVEGSYVLEIHATWEPAGARDGTGTRLGRLIRRRKSSAVVNSATRRVFLAVVAPNPADRPQTPFVAAETARPRDGGRLAGTGSNSQFSGSPPGVDLRCEAGSNPLGLARRGISRCGAEGARARPSAKPDRPHAGRTLQSWSGR